MWRQCWRKTTDRRIGVLLAQLGTPDAPTPAALRRYLRQFLSDPRVVERNRLLWWFILRLLVLPRRPRRSAALYQRIWTRDGSPLLVISRSQARALEAELTSPRAGPIQGRAGHALRQSVNRVGRAGVA